MHAWGAAAGSDKLYLIVRGELVFNEHALPRADLHNHDATPPMTRIEGFLGGEQLGRNGFLRPYQGEVTLEVSCYGPWCAGIVSGASYVVFVELREGEKVVATNPCGGFVFPATDEIEQDLARCMRQGRCEVPLE